MRLSRFAFAAFTALVVSLALPACGGDDGSEVPVDLPGGTLNGTGEPAKEGPIKADAPPGDVDPGAGGPADAPKAKAGADGAKALLAEFMKPNADLAKLSAALRPTTADHVAVFKGDAAAKMEAHYKAAWDLGRLVLTRKSHQTELLLWAASSEDLQKSIGNAGKFPGGYKSIVQHLNPGIVWYRFKFVKPGETLGMAYDGLVYVNGHWTIFPKPWRALR